MHVDHKVNHEKMLDHKRLQFFQVNKFNNFVDSTSLLELFAVMESQDFVLVLRAFVRVLVSVLKVSGLFLVSKATSLGHKANVLRLSIFQGYGLVKFL